MKLYNTSFLNTPNYSDKYPSILLYLLPVALVTGPFIADLFLSLIALYFLIISLKKKLFSYYKNLFVYIFLFFYFYLLLRSFFSEDIYYSLRGCLFYFRYLFFTLSVFYLFNNVPNLARNLGVSIFFTLIIVGLDGYYHSSLELEFYKVISQNWKKAWTDYFSSCKIQMILLITSPINEVPII